MNRIRILGAILFLVSVSVGIFSQSRANLLFEPARAASKTTTVAPDGTIYTTTVLAHAIQIHWTVVLPLIGVVVIGVFCFASAPKR